MSSGRIPLAYALTAVRCERVWTAVGGGRTIRGLGGASAQSALIIIKVGAGYDDEAANADSAPLAPAATMPSCPGNGVRRGRRSGELLCRPLSASPSQRQPGSMTDQAARRPNA